MNMHTIRVVQPQDLAGKRIELIDVRPADDFRALHAVGARSVPLDRLDPQAVWASRTGSADETLYFICRVGQSSGRACEQMIAAGFTNVANVAGGMEAWVAAGLPTERGSTDKKIRIERQTRSTVGVLVLLGLALGYWVHPGFYALSALVGLGLTLSGVTNTCPMSTLLERMPWNR